jgi:hypothetical protein
MTVKKEFEIVTVAFFPGNCSSLCPHLEYDRGMTSHPYCRLFMTWQPYGQDGSSIAIHRCDACLENFGLDFPGLK